MKKIILIFFILFVEFNIFPQNHGISEDMLNLLRKQGYNIDGPTPPMDATERIKATLNIDYNKSRGLFKHFEKYNNFSHSLAFAEQRKEDISFYNEIGLYGEIYRVWMEQNRYYDEKTGNIIFHEMADYLSDASKVSKYLMVNCNHLGVFDEWDFSPEEKVKRLTAILKALKTNYPKVKYIEVTNEPDYSQQGFTPENYYDSYQIFYKAVNNVNALLNPTIKLEVGGPSTAQFSIEWLSGFFNSYNADPSKDKRIDFISYHGYFTKPDQDYIMFKDNPSLVNKQKKKLENLMKEKGIDLNTPVFVTEMGLYPGPSFDDFKTMKFDHLRQATGMSSLYFWYNESQNIFPFNWVFRHQTEGRKDQLVSRDEAGNPFIQIGKLTPYGNAMLMFSKMKEERLEVENSATLFEGKGLYCIASKGESGIALMIWNYQGTQTKGFDFDLNLNNLPINLGENCNYKVFRIDQKNSNYHFDLNKANLNLTENSKIAINNNFKNHYSLEPNTMLMILIEN